MECAMIFFHFANMKISRRILSRVVCLFGFEYVALYCIRSRLDSTFLAHMPRLQFS